MTAKPGTRQPVTGDLAGTAGTGGPRKKMKKTKKSHCSGPTPGYNLFREIALFLLIPSLSRRAEADYTIDIFSIIDQASAEPVFSHRLFLCACLPPRSVKALLPYVFSGSSRRGVAVPARREESLRPAARLEVDDAADVPAALGDHPPRPRRFTALGTRWLPPCTNTQLNTHLLAGSACAGLA